MIEFDYYELGCWFQSWTTCRISHAIISWWLVLVLLPRQIHYRNPEKNREELEIIAYYRCLVSFKWCFTCTGAQPHASNGTQAVPFICCNIPWGFSGAFFGHQLGWRSAPDVQHNIPEFRYKKKTRKVVFPTVQAPFFRGEMLNSLDWLAFRSHNWWPVWWLTVTVVVSYSQVT